MKRPRAKTIVELAQKGRFYVAKRPIPLAADALKVLGADSRQRLGALGMALAPLDNKEWTAPALEAELRRFADSGGMKLGAIAQPLRAALTGSLASPGLFEVMEVLGRDETLARITEAGRA